MFKKAFTLMEVNLAIMVMAGGLLSSVALFSYGYRESRHSSEDVAAAAYAEELMGRMVLALGDTNVTWKAFNALDDLPSSNCWGDYFDDEGDVISNPNNTAQNKVWNEVMGITGGSGISSDMPKPPDILKGIGLVVTHDRNSPVVKIAFRASAKKSTLMSSPIYFTEVIFHGGDE